MRKKEVFVGRGCFSPLQTKMNGLIQHRGQLPAQPGDVTAERPVTEHDGGIINMRWTAFSGDNSVPVLHLFVWLLGSLLTMYSVLTLFKKTVKDRLNLFFTTFSTSRFMLRALKGLKIWI